MFGLSKDKEFYELFEKAANNTCQGAKALDDLLQNYPKDVEQKIKRMKDIEHQGDQLTHQTVEMVNKTFVTPLEREDIYALITKLDDVLDFMDAAASRLSLYKIPYVTEHAKSFGKILVKATEVLSTGISSLRKIKDQKCIFDCCIAVNTIENEGDVLLRKSMVELFEGKKDDPIYVIKWKEIYEDLERATDRCEDVANIVEGIVLKNA
ncbi:MAG: DUF47 domain-containing protein [Planctomycetes bacterium]|nr:DUF47 domain-containing protein [Planctomycetota bacterium]